MEEQKVDLVKIFGAVTQALAENQPELDQADEYNQNHGSNMVQTFQTITDALENKKSSTDSAALSYAAKTLSKNSNSGSSRMYAENLALAADKFEGKQVDSRGAMDLLQTLIGAGQSSGSQSGGGDMLSTLLGSLAGGETSSQGSLSGGGDMLTSLLGGLASGGTSSQGSSSGGGDMLTSLLGALTSGGTASQGSSSDSGDMLSTLLSGLSGSGSSSTGTGQGGVNMQSLLSAGLAYMRAKQNGGSNMQAMVQAFMALSGMGNSSHRSQSTEVVVNSFLKALGAANG